MTETPAKEVGLAADILLASNPQPRDRAIADLLNRLAGTWDSQPQPIRHSALALARTVPPPVDTSMAPCDTCGHPGIAHPKGGFCVGMLPYGESCRCDDYEPEES